ncbi:MAG: hypothetical protein Q8P46_03365 [Hyphomicrobiales bacterium]|nr:hypothetical protein [Hyphomicrobiales bacterium]
MAKRHELEPGDAIRLLCNAIQAVHHIEAKGEGLSPPCRNAGELILQDALRYLAFGDMAAVRGLLDNYEDWLETSKAGWPYDE